MSAPYIPREIVEKHRLRVALRVEPSVALNARLEPKEEDPILGRLARSFVPEIVKRMSYMTEPQNYNQSIACCAELFVFTREELADILESRYLRVEPWQPPA